MPLVTAERLNSFLSKPHWSDEQWIEAEDVCAEVEDELRARLNAPISPGLARTETAVLIDSGLLVCKLPVHTVTRFNGVDIPEGDPLPEGWMLDEGYVTKDDPTTAYPFGYPTLGGPAAPYAHHAFGLSAITLTYVPGWGDVPALRSAILRKCQARWLNRHDDTVTARDLSAEAPPPLPEEWTDADIKALHLYKWTTVHR